MNFDIEAENNNILQLVNHDPNTAYKHAVANLRRAQQSNDENLIIRTMSVLGHVALEYRPYPKLNEALDINKSLYKKSLELNDGHLYATAQFNLGLVYYKLYYKENNESNLDLALEAFRNALHIFTEENFPEEYAMTQRSLGNAYVILRTKNREENINLAIEAYQNALRIFTEERYPDEYATTQNDLGEAYRNLPHRES